MSYFSCGRSGPGSVERKRNRAGFSERSKARFARNDYSSLDQVQRDAAGWPGAARGWTGRRDVCSTHSNMKMAITWSCWAPVAPMVCLQNCSLPGKPVAGRSGGATARAREDSAGQRALCAESRGCGDPRWPARLRVCHYKRKSCQFDRGSHSGLPLFCRAAQCADANIFEKGPDHAASGDRMRGAARSGGPDKAGLADLL